MTAGFLKRLLAMLIFVAGGVAAEGLRPVSCTLLHVAAGSGQRSTFRVGAQMRRCGGLNHKV